MESVKHFSHKHLLSLYDPDRIDFNADYCKGCRKGILSDRFYGCKRCSYWVCKPCFAISEQIQHPFHKEHPLFRFAQSPYTSNHPSQSSDESAYCSVCNKKCGGFIFHCSLCDFDLDMNCATLTPCKTQNYSYHNKDEEDGALVSTHPHPLIPCHRNNTLLVFECSVCELPIKNTVHVCLHCSSLMDKSCAQLPQHITHPFHPNHSLTLKDCFHDGFRSGTRFCYSCSDCQFGLDLRWASLMPKGILIANHANSVEEHSRMIFGEMHFAHSHVSIPCDTDVNNKFSHTCSVCELSIEKGTLYACVECKYFLHKSCAELGLEIKHPFHPLHTLLLARDDIQCVRTQCGPCGWGTSGYRYQCTECEFYMHISCALQNYSSFQFQLHQHPLAFIKDDKGTDDVFHENDSLFCNMCQLPLTYYSFRCVPCNFNLHLSCVPRLPLEFIHSDHGHPLTFTYSRIVDRPDDDDFNSKYYCDVCERRRRLLAPTYYCEECNFVAHINCVFDEIFPLLGTEWPLAPNEGIVMLQDEVKAIKAKLAPLITELDEQKERRAQLIDHYRTGAIEAEARNDPAIAGLDEHLEKLQAEIDSERVKLKTVKRKLNEQKERRTQLIDTYRIRSNWYFFHKIDEEVEEDSDVEPPKKEVEDEESINVTYNTIADIDEELEAEIAKLELLRMKRARHIISRAQPWLQNRVSMLRSPQ